MEFTNCTFSPPTLPRRHPSLQGLTLSPKACKGMFLSTICVIAVAWLLWSYVIRLYLLRRFYEKQGIPFVDNCYAVIGAEMRVTALHHNNKSHDWLYTDRPTDIYGTIRGFSLQLYTTNADACEALIAKTGHSVDRDTPALFSFGRLSPFALTFLPT